MKIVSNSKVVCLEKYEWLLKISMHQYCYAVIWHCHISPHFLCFQLRITLFTFMITLIKLHSHLRAAKCQLQSNLILRCDTLHLAPSSVADHYDDDDHEDDENDFNNCWSELDKVPRLSISDDICILSSDVICQLHQLFSNSEAAMLSNLNRFL